MKSSITRREFLRYLGMGSAAAVLSACSPQPTPTTAPPLAATAVPPAATAVRAAATVAPTVAKGPEALTLPIVKEPMAFTYWAELTPNVAATLTTYGDMACYKELEKRTGIHIDFQHPPINKQQEQFNLLIASGKYPDMLEWNYVLPTATPGGPGKLLKDGVIIRLNDLIAKYAPNLTKVLDDHPDWRRMVMTDEGDIYCFPFLRGDPYLLTFTGPTIRKDWLDKLGLSVPTTVDEWHDVLKAFKEKDPNGNGKADEIPFTPWFSVGNPALNSRAAFIRFFLIGAWGISTDWYQETGIVKYGPLQPEFKEFLRTVAQWCKEGLIDPDFASSDQKTVDAKVTGNQLGALSMNTGGGIGKYMPLLMGKDPKAKLVAAPNVALKKGDKPPFGHREFNYPGQGSVAITTANKHVTETVKWLDYGYSPEGHLLFNFGVEGVSYSMKDGYPTYTDAMFKDPQLAPAQVMSKYMRAAFNGPFVQDRRYMEQYSTLQEQKDSITIWMDAVNDKLMPPVTPTQDESKKFASVMNDINTRYDETFTKVLAGQLPLDAWDTFVKDLKTMGIDDAIKIQQAALERYNKRA